MPPKPPQISERNYRFMQDHLIGRKTYEQISYPPDLARTRIAQIVERGLLWALSEQGIPVPDWFAE